MGGVKGAKNDAPFYIIKKDVPRNILYVNQGECPELYSSSLDTENFNYISGEFKNGTRVLVRTRHREPLRPATAYKAGVGVHIEFDNPERAVTPGQYAVLYSGNVCLGGGVIR